MVVDMSQTEPLTRIASVMETIRQRIGAGSLPVGSKLPSVRAFAGTIQSSVSTVVEAYNRLVAEGTIVSRAGSGFFVAPQVIPLKLSNSGPKVDRAIDPLWISRQSLEANDTVLKPGCGWLPASWLPEHSVRKALRTVSRGEVDSLSKL